MFQEKYITNHIREQSIIRNVYLQVILLIPEYLAFIKPCKLLGFLIFLMYAFIVTLANFLTGETFFKSNFIPEYFSLVGLLLMVFSSSYFDSIRREIFIHIKQTETFSNYFEALINNMQIQVVSFSNNKLALCNDSYIKYMNEENIFQVDIEDNFKSPIKSNNERENIIETELVVVNKESCSFNSIEYLSKFKLADIQEVTNFFQVSKINFSDCLKNRTQWTLMNFLEILTNYGHSCTKDNINNSFFYLGIFTNLSASKFFKIYYRIFYLDNNRVIVDFMIDDISQLKKAEVITSESKIKNKLFSKFAHEFKTPLLVIKSLVNDLTENLHIKSREDLEPIGNHIMYLSEYIHFLINDIIYYTNNTAITIQKDIVDLREVIEFTSCVTNALIAVMPENKKKYHYQK